MFKMKKIILVVLMFALIPISYALPAVGTQGIDTTYPNYFIGGSYYNPWEVCRSDSETAWISGTQIGVFNADAVCQSLGYDIADAWGGTCGTVCGFCEENTFLNPSGQVDWEHYIFTGGSTGVQLTGTVHWRCRDFPEDDNDDKEVPEFSSIIATAVLAGAIIFFQRKKKT